MKTCVDCGESKPEEEFYRLRKREEARQARCKPCDNKNRLYGRAGKSNKIGSVEVKRLDDGSLVMIRKGA